MKAFATRSRVFICDTSGLSLRHHPACSCRYPREACCRCADDGVRSPPDNVPNWEENREVDFPSGNPPRLRARMGQYGESRQRTLRVVIEHRPTGFNRSKRASQCLHELERLQVNNVPARNPISYRRPSST